MFEAEYAAVQKTNPARTSKLVIHEVNSTDPKCVEDVISGTVAAISAMHPADGEFQHRRKSTNPLSRVFSNQDLDHDGAK
jgi:hypothetical protein